jgi:hypothetical protein
VSGLEQGRTGYGFRAVTPLFLDSKHIGSLEAGYELGDELLIRFLKSYPGNWAIYNLARGSGSLDDRALIKSVGDSKEKFFKNLMPEEYVIKSAKAGVALTELDESSNAKIIYIPIKNFQGDYVLLLKFIGETQYFNALSEIKNNAILICLFGFFLSSGIIILLYRMITLPIKGLVIETEKIKNFELDGTIKIPAKLEELKGLIIIDEIQRVPDLFPILRVLVDQNKATQRYLILGSASRDLIQQSSETLAGRINYLELTPFGIEEVSDLKALWLRGGFPDSFLAKSEFAMFNE